MTGANGRAPTTRVSASSGALTVGSILTRAAQSPATGRLARSSARSSARSGSKQEIVFSPRTVQGVDRALAIGMILLCQGQVQVITSRRGEQIDLSAQLVKSWAHVAFCLMNSSERVTALRRLERVAGVSSQGGWQYDLPEQAIHLFTGADRLPELGLRPKDARSVVHNIVLLAAQLPNPLVLRNGGSSDRSIALPPVSTRVMEQLESLVERHLKKVTSML